MDLKTEERLRGYLNRIIQTTGELSSAKIVDEKTNYSLPYRNYFIVLQKYLRLFFERQLAQRIIVLPGLRGIGKTTLLFQLYDFLIKNYNTPKEKMIYFDAGELINNHGGNMGDLFKIYEEIYLTTSLEKSSDNIIIFIDEAHYDQNWPFFVKSLFDRSDGNKNVLIVVSGSSALALKANTDLSRRAVIGQLFPLTLQEFLHLKYSFLPPRGTAEKIRIGLNSDVNSAFHILSTTFNSLQVNFVKKNIDIEKILMEYLSIGASPLSIVGGPSDLYFRWWNTTLEKVVQQDIPTFSPLGSKSSNKVFSILQFLASSIPSSPQSFQNISSKLNDTEFSKTTVYNIFEALKSACIIIEVHAEGDSLKKVTASSKYYFMHPTIRASLLWSLGKFKKEIPLNDPSTFGSFLEDVLASVFLRNREIGSTIQEFFYDNSRNPSSDFCIKTPTGTISIECCWGTKDTSQIRKTMEKFNCKFGILISKTNQVILKDNILIVPRELLLFI